MIQIFKKFKPVVDLTSLRCQNKLSRTASRLYSIPASSFTKKITLPENNNENLRASILGYDTTKNAADKNNKDYKFYCSYGDSAYNYYAKKALNLKYPDVTGKEFMKIYGTLRSRDFLTEIAKVCELDKMLPNTSGNLGERMGAYCS